MGHEKVAAQTGAVIKSTGQAANVTQRQVEGLAGALMRKSGVDDEAIQSSENMLLTFTNLRNEAGKGNDVFNQATKAVLDMDEAMTHGASTAESLSHTSILVGKALQDPIKGATALRRVGVSLTEAQQKQIKAFVKAGDVMSAQKIVLGELTKEFGGSAKAIGDTLPGKLNLLRESFNNLAGDLFSVFAPGLTRVTGEVADFISKFAAARGWRAKLNIIWEGAEGVATSVQQKIGDAIAAVDWTAVWNRAQGIGDGIKQRFESIDWADVGTTIGNGIATGVGAGSALAKRLAESLSEMAKSIDWNALGRSAGPGLAAAIAMAISTFLDPAFWLRNWDLALSIGLVMFGGAIGRIAGRFAEPLVKLLGDAWERGILAAAAAVSKSAPKIGDALLDALIALPRLVGGLLGKVLSVAESLFGRLNAVAQFVVKVLGVDQVIHAIASLATDVYNKLKELIPRMVSLGVDIVTGIAAGIYGQGAAAVRAAVEWLSSLIPGWAKHILGIASPSRVMADEVGKPLGQGVVVGWIAGTADLPSKMSEKLRNAVDAARQTVDAQRSKFSESFGALTTIADNALDAIASKVKTKTERLLDKIVSKHDAEEFKQNLADAQAALATAKAELDQYIATSGGTPDQLQKVADATTKVTLAQQAYNDAVAKGGEASAKAMSALVTLHGAQSALAKAQADVGVDPTELASKQSAVTSAQKTIDDLLYQQKITALQKRADAERINLDAQQAVRKGHFDAELAGLQEHLTKTGATAAQATDSILALMRKYGIHFKNVGQDMGVAWIEGFKEAIAAAASGAGKLSGTIGDLAASIKIPGRASGGPVSAGSPYVVGENGPELFVPGRSGRIVPNGAMSSGGGGSAINITVHGWVGDEDALARKIQHIIVKSGKRTGSFAGRYA